MRILLISSSYPPVLGGLQTVAHTLAQLLIRRGHDVVVVTNRYPRSLPAKEVLDGVPVRRLLFLYPRLRYFQARRPDLFLAGFYFFPLSLFHLSQLVKAFKPDVVNVHYPDSQNLFVLWLRRRYPFRLVVSLHGYEVEGFDRATSWDRRLLQQLLQEADVVTACSQYLLDRATSIEPSGAAKGRAIHNGIDPARFEDCTPHRHPRPYILAYGRLTYQKGFDLLLQAFRQVAPFHPKVDLIIAGNGEERTALETLCRQLGLNDRVAFYGRATPQEVVALLNGSEFVVVPSRWEPFGIVALEAMAAGKPVLATRVGGLPEFLADGGRWTMDDGPWTREDRHGTMLVEPTVEGLVTGLAEWLKRRDEVKALGEQNRERAAEHTWEQVVERYLEVYQWARRQD